MAKKKATAASSKQQQQQEQRRPLTTSAPRKTAPPPATYTKKNNAQLQFPSSKNANTVSVTSKEITKIVEDPDDINEIFWNLMVGRCDVLTDHDDDAGGGNEWGLNESGLVISSLSIMEWERRQIEQRGEVPMRVDEKRWAMLERRAGQLVDGRGEYWKPE